MTEERSHKRNTCLDYLILGGIVVIGLAETAHLAAILFGLSFTECVTLLWGLIGAGLLFGLGLFCFRRVKRKGSHKEAHKGRRSAGFDILAAVFAAVVVSQLIFICGRSAIYRQGDMTVETVGSFLVSDGIYQVNPMTGLLYEEGIPSRLKILCLPTLYGSLCKITGLSPRTVIWGIVPAVTLLASYAAFASLGCCLFRENQHSSANETAEDMSSEDALCKGAASGFVQRRWDGKKLGCFMIAAALLLWAGAYRYGVDGFNLLYCGYRGVVIRNMVLVPWLFSLCLRRKWFCAFLCILAEACMVWTLYGMGVCLFITAGMAVIQAAYGIISGRLCKSAES